MEEQVVGGGQQGGRRVQVGPERPEGLDLGRAGGQLWVSARAGGRQESASGAHGVEGGDLFDSLFVVRDLVPGRTLLPEPEHPAVVVVCADGWGRE